jgi:hypothetical protein
MNRSSKMLYNTQVMERTRRLAESKLIEVYKTAFDARPVQAGGLRVREEAIVYVRNAAVNFVIDKTPNITFPYNFVTTSRGVVTKGCPFQLNQFNTYLTIM